MLGHGNRFPTRMRLAGAGPASPIRLADSIGEGVGDAAAKARGVFRNPEQDAAVALPLEIAPDADQAKACPALANEIDAHYAHDFAVAQQHVWKVAGRDLVAVVCSS
jgi:hypothetical protein